MASPLLEVRDLTVTFPKSGGSGDDVRAVRGVSYTVSEGETLGIVGESGSGKSVSSLAVMGLLPTTARVTGEILFDGRPLLTMNDRSLNGVTAQMRSTQGAAGNGFGFSWPAAFPMARIDQIMVQDVEPVSSWTLPRTGSDHLPVAARVNLDTSS